MIHRKRLIIILIFTLLASCLVFFFVYPAFKSIKAISATIAEKKARIVTLQEQEKALSDFKKKYEGYKKNLEAVEGLFVDKSNPIKLIEFMETAAASAGIQAQINLATLEEKNVQTYPVMFFNVTAQGSFPSLRLFSNDLETGPYLISIQKVTVKKASKNLEEKSVSSDILEANFLLAVIAK